MWKDIDKHIHLAFIIACFLFLCVLVIYKYFLSFQGVKEITLLGQNVNSYRDLSSGVYSRTFLSSGFKTVYKERTGGLRFADLLDKVADINPEMRIRFTSPHPKDFPDDVSL